MVGASVGLIVGAFVKVGDIVGFTVGENVGASVGFKQNPSTDPFSVKHVSIPLQQTNKAFPVVLHNSNSFLQPNVGEGVGALVSSMPRRNLPSICTMPKARTKKVKKRLFVL